MKRNFIVLFVLLIGGLVWFMFPKSRDEIVSASIPVRVHEIVSGSITETIVIPGTTRSAEQAVLRFQVSGRVSSKSVRLGDSVSTGDILAIMDNPEIQPLASRAGDNLQQLEVELSQAQRDFSRIDGLYKEQAVTKQEWEKVKTSLASAKTAVSGASAEKQRADRLAKELKLVAPFAGVITEILIDEGEVVQAGTAAIRLSNPAEVELELAVSDALIRNLNQGQEVAVLRSLDPTAEVIKGSIIDISPYRERGALPQVIVALDANEIQPGIAVSTQLSINRQSGVAIPIQAIIRTGEDLSAVYVVREGVVHIVPVRPLKIGTSSVTVDSGLELGEKVVIAGISQLFDGAKVEIQP